MKKAIALLAACVAASVGVDALGDLTQDRPDQRVPGSRSEVVLEVSSRIFGGAPVEAARSLAAVCRPTVQRYQVLDPLVPLGGDRFLLVTEPAVGTHAWRRLRGCLEDLTIDRVLGRVVSKQDVPPGG